jgi:hypothetical protein
MAQKFYVDDFGGPLTVNVFASDGETPVLPLSATIDIINMNTGAQVVTGGACTVASGLAAYTIPAGSPATATAGQYVGYITVLIEPLNQLTEEVYFNVFEKTSYLIIERWRAKTIDSAPTEDHVDDDEAREWIDQAVGWINKRFDSGYTSTLAAISPTATATDTEFIASVASLMARTAWYAGRGTYRDDEISYDARSIAQEWEALDKYFAGLNTSALFDVVDDSGYTVDGVTNRNRDGVFYRGRWFEDADPALAPYYREWISTA